jgi:hypothetical protein
VTVFAPGRRQIVFLTHIRGSGDDAGVGIALDTQGEYPHSRHYRFAQLPDSECVSSLASGAETLVLMRRVAFRLLRRRRARLGRRGLFKPRVLN